MLSRGSRPVPAANWRLYRAAPVASTTTSGTALAPMSSTHHGPVLRPLVATSRAAPPSSVSQVHGALMAVVSRSGHSFCLSCGNNYAHPRGVKRHAVLIHLLRFDVRNNTLIGFTSAQDLEKAQESCHKAQWLGHRRRADMKHSSFAPSQGGTTACRDRIGDQPIQGARSVGNNTVVMQGSRTSVPAACSPVVSRSFFVSSSCRLEVLLPDFDDISDAEGPTVDAAYFLRSMPLPLSVSRVVVSEGDILPSPPVSSKLGIILRCHQLMILGM